MKSLVIHEGHRIVVEHHLDSMTLFVDEVKRAEIIGLKNVNRDNVLSAAIANQNGETDEIRVEYEDAQMMKLTGKLSFYYNGKLIAEKRTM